QVSRASETIDKYRQRSLCNLRERTSSLPNLIPEQLSTQVPQEPRKKFQTANSLQDVMNEY
ncbi:hypothetical protein L9F63_015681, partial [Diploptera punctata]